MKKIVIYLRFEFNLVFCFFRFKVRALPGLACIFSNLISSTPFRVLYGSHCKEALKKVQYLF